MRVVLISGGSSGFGALCARAFAAAGDHVIATMRNPAAHPFAEAELVDVRALDVTDPVSIRHCVSSVLADHGRIDVLVNNAGVHLQGAVEDMDEAGFRRVMETNFFGVVNLTRAVLPAMREQGRGHVIAVSSIGARIGRVMDGAYCASKAALEAAFEALRYEVARFGIRVAVVSPGAFRTAIGGKVEVLADRSGESPYAELAAFRLQKVREAVDLGGDPLEVAHAIRRIAADPSPAFRHVVGDRALELQHLLAEADEAEREALIRRFSGIDWWLSGADRPPGAAQT